MSGSHCSVSVDFESCEITVTDTSSNGTYVDGAALSKRAIEVHEGQQISLLPPGFESASGIVPTFDVRVVRRAGAAPPPSGVRADAECADVASESGKGGKASKESKGGKGSKSGQEGKDGKGGPDGKEFNDRAAFWARREALDKRLSAVAERLQSQVLRHSVGLLRPATDGADASTDASGCGGAGADGGDCASRPLLLLIDEPLQPLLWESIPALREQPVCRLPCSALIGRCLGAAAALSAEESAADLNSLYYLLNPSGDLQRTQAALKHQIESPPWVGVIGEPPSPPSLQAALGQKDVFLYCGHGDGRRYVGSEQLQQLPRCPASLLIGCSSGVLKPNGGLAPGGMALTYLHAGCPALFANLWDVTDGEADRLTTALLSLCTVSDKSAADEDQTTELLSVVAKARSACRLPFLTGGAGVVYGVPLALKKKGRQA